VNPPVFRCGKLLWLFSPCFKLLLV